MTKALQSIPYYLMPYSWIIVFGLALSVIWGVQGLIEYNVRDWTLSWEGECTVTDWRKNGEIGFNASCGEEGETSVTDSSVVRSYMNDPGPIWCRRYLTDSFTCDARLDRK